MRNMNRRQWLGGAGAVILTGGARLGKPEDPAPLELGDFEPRSMLHVPETQVLRSRFPAIDVHTHITKPARDLDGVDVGEDIRVLAKPAEILAVMDRKNLRALVDLTGNYGRGLEQAVRTFQQPHAGRFLVFTEPTWERFPEPHYPQWQADELGKACRAGAKGLKVEKILGLYLREKVTTGPLVKVDDRRFAPMWEACAALNLPVAIHVSDPEAFFLPIDRFNERFEELHHHPDWSFHGRDYPGNSELLKARNRLFARHPKTTFIAVHVGHNAENLAYVSECMDKFPNMYVDLAARVGELGRQPRNARAFFAKHQDRILFGTDAVPNGTKTPQQIFGDQLYEIYFRFLETEDEYFDYAPAPKPPQGRWRIYGVGLPESLLRKVYYENAERILRIKA